MNYEKLTVADLTLVSKLDRENPIKTRQILKGRFRANDVTLSVYKDSDPDIERDLLKSLQIIRDCCPHPGINSLLAAFVDAHVFLFVNELCIGNFQQLLCHHELSPERAITYLLQLVNAVHFMHRQGYLHSDIKPSNILLQSGGNLQLCNLELALRINENGYGKDDSRTRAVGGSVGYQPIEVSQAGIYSTKSDSFSIGATLYYFLKRRHLFKKILSVPEKSTQVDETIKSLTQTPQTELGERLYREKCPLSTLIQKMVVYDPNLRMTCLQVYDDPNIWSMTNKVKENLYQENKWNVDLPEKILQDDLGKFSEILYSSSDSHKHTKHLQNSSKSAFYFLHETIKSSDCSTVFSTEIDDSVDISVEPVITPRLQDVEISIPPQDCDTVLEVYSADGMPSLVPQVDPLIQPTKHVTETLDTQPMNQICSNFSQVSQQHSEEILHDLNEMPNLTPQVSNSSTLQSLPDKITNDKANFTPLPKRARRKLKNFYKTRPAFNKDGTLKIKTVPNIPDGPIAESAKSSEIKETRTYKKGSCEKKFGQRTLKMSLRGKKQQQDDKNEEFQELPPRIPKPRPRLPRQESDENISPEKVDTGRGKRRVGEFYDSGGKRRIGQYYESGHIYGHSRICAIKYFSNRNFNIPHPVDAMTDQPSIIKHNQELKDAQIQYLIERMDQIYNDQMYEQKQECEKPKVILAEPNLIGKLLSEGLANSFSSSIPCPFTLCQELAFDDNIDECLLSDLDEYADGSTTNEIVMTNEQVLDLSISHTISNRLIADRKDEGSASDVSINPNTNDLNYMFKTNQKPLDLSIQQKNVNKSITRNTRKRSASDVCIDDSNILNENETRATQQMQKRVKLDTKKLKVQIQPKRYMLTDLPTQLQDTPLETVCGTPYNEDWLRCKNVTLKIDDACSLIPGQQLSEEILDELLTMVTSDDNTRSGTSFSTTTTRMITAKSPRHKGLSDSELVVEIFKDNQQVLDEIKLAITKDYEDLLFPTIVSKPPNSHYVLIIVDLKNKDILIGDPCNPDGTLEDIAKLKPNAIFKEMSHIIQRFRIIFSSLQPGKWDNSDVHWGFNSDFYDCGLEKQLDDSSCGAIVVQIAEKMLGRQRYKSVSEKVLFAKWDKLDHDTYAGLRVRLFYQLMTLYKNQ